MAADESREIVVIERSSLEKVRRLAAEDGVTVQEFPARGLEPVSTVAILLVGGAAAVALLLYKIDQGKGGQVVDLRPGVPKPVYRTTDVVYGTVVILTMDGSATIEVKEPRGALGEVMDSLRTITVDVAKAGIEAVAEAARAGVGDKAVVTTQARGA